MELRRLEIPEVLILTPRRFGDDRGFFSETYNQATLRALGVETVFVQDNMSMSRQVGTLRGLHFQSPPHAQAKLVSAARGRIRDVVVDARRGSPTYGRHVAVELGADTGAQIYVPVGFLHGYVTLEPDTLVTYKASAHYAPACDGAVRWNDPDLAIDWGVDPTQSTLSTKDAAAQSFADFVSPFVYGDAA
jgi:dTDP-4-dehydrorhamnose 3,5-epimerase